MKRFVATATIVWEQEYDEGEWEFYTSPSEYETETINLMKDPETLNSVLSWGDIESVSVDVEIVDDPIIV